MFKSVKGCHCGTWWMVLNYRQNENWDGELSESVFSKIWYLEICSARCEVDEPGINIGRCLLQWQIEITCSSGGGTNAVIASTILDMLRGISNG